MSTFGDKANSTTSTDADDDVDEKTGKKETRKGKRDNRVEGRDRENKEEAQGNNNEVNNIAWLTIPFAAILTICALLFHYTNAPSPEMIAAMAMMMVTVIAISTIVMITKLLEYITALLH